MSGTIESICAKRKEAHNPDLKDVYRDVCYIYRATLIRSLVQYRNILSALSLYSQVCILEPQFYILCISGLHYRTQRSVRRSRDYYAVGTYTQISYLRVYPNEILADTQRGESHCDATLTNNNQLYHRSRELYLRCRTTSQKREISGRDPRLIRSASPSHLGRSRLWRRSPLISLSVQGRRVILYHL